MKRALFLVFAHLVVFACASQLLAQPLEEEEEMMQPFRTFPGASARSIFTDGFESGDVSALRDLNKDGTPDAAFFKDDPDNPGSKILIIRDGTNPGFDIYDAPIQVVSAEPEKIRLIGFFDIIPGALRTIVLAHKAGNRFVDPVVINPNINTFWSEEGKRLLTVADMDGDVCYEVVLGNSRERQVEIWKKK